MLIHLQPNSSLAPAERCQFAPAAGASACTFDFILMPDRTSHLIWLGSVLHRFRDNVVVQGEPRIRFFVGAPLVASNGHRLGTLCYLGPQPRVTTAEEAMILANMAGATHEEAVAKSVSCGALQMDVVA